ncbi:MAG: hypothetical protein JNK74_22980 [Candidatus Hydrogenedentes bacterium]|nr:hypothetical protein [Candidatus Hydrogenedentota bacterium]
MSISRTLTAISLSLLAGCGPESPPVATSPAPGTWRMISVERVDESDADALLPNGNFEVWHAGLPAPQGFHAPARISESTLVRDAKRGHLGATGYTARQTWRGPGTDAPPEQGFSTKVNLAPDTQYRLEVIASATAGFGAAICAVEIGDGGPRRTLARSVVEVRGETPARFKGTFRTRAGGTVLLSSHALAGSAFPGAVVWSAWRLEESAEATEPVNVADVAPRRALVGQALDQIRGQAALYGGVESWARATTPNRDAAARLLSAGGAPGRSILGDEHVVAAREELDWFAQHSAPRDSDFFGPARAALRRAERALNARGVQLVVIPVPERIQLTFGAFSDAAIDLPVNLSAHAALVEQLLVEDVLVLDPAPVLWTMKSEGIPLFWNGDGDVPSATLKALAEWCAPRLLEMGLLAPEGLRQAYTEKVDEIPVEQRLVAGLPEELRATIPEEAHAIQSVRDGKGELFRPAPASPVLAAGSLAILHHVRGASFAAHLSRALGFPVALPEKHLPDPEIPAWLASGQADELATAQWVVFCVPERSLTLEGWK